MSFGNKGYSYKEGGVLLRKRVRLVVDEKVKAVFMFSLVIPEPPHDTDRRAPWPLCIIDEQLSSS